MSKCDVRIVLDREDGLYEVGETVRGVVQVKVNASCNCKKLTITRQWRTHGRGNRAKGPKHEEVLFSGNLTPGQHQYPFEFPAPAGPLTYRGHYLNVDWYLLARVDLPWAIDPKAETELLLMRGDYEGELDFGAGPDGDINDMVTPRATGAIVMGCFGAVFAFMGGGALLSMILADASNKPPIPVYIVPCIFILVGLGIGYLGIRNILAERKLGGVDVTLDNPMPSAGDIVTCIITFQPQSTVKLNSIAVTVEGEEVVVRGSGSNRTTYTHSLFEDKATLIERKQASVGREIVLEHSFQVPEDAPPTFRASDNALNWQVSVAIDIPKWPDWSKEFPFVVS